MQNDRQPSLSTSGVTPIEEALRNSHILPNSSLSIVSSVTGWNRLPLECLENIVEVLDDDTNTLAKLLQVNRQWFFLVVPKLYKDPFKRIVDISHSKSNSVRISSTATVGEDLEAESCFVQNQDKILTFLTIQHQTREILLYLTLFSTLIQRLCDRFPILHNHFYSSPPDCQFDFGPYHRQVTWTSQCYLRHLIVVDLEKLWTRIGRYQSISELMSKRCTNDATVLTGKEGIFSKIFSPAHWDKKACSIGVLDYLQRAILTQPGADRIQCLRIPVHRLKTYQERHQRIPRKKSQVSSEFQDPNHDPPQENVSRIERQLDEESEETNTWYPPTSTTTATTRDVNESQRPYCFTFKKLSNLHHLEICVMDDNIYGWQTLDRVLSSMFLHSRCFSSGSVINGESIDSSSFIKPSNFITKFSIHSQGSFSSLLYNILAHFKHLEVLELRNDGVQNLYQFYYWISICDDDLCRRLRVLRMGTSFLIDNTLQTYESFGKLANLEELRIILNTPEQFRWINDAKRCIRPFPNSTLSVDQSSCEQPILADNAYLKNSQVLSRCLPKLRKLSCMILGPQSQNTFEVVTEAFCHQLEEFNVYFGYNPKNVRFEHSFKHLSRLAIRGLDLDRFDFVSLVQCCPAIEMLAMECDLYTTLSKDAIVEAMINLKSLRCLYLEGYWRLNSEQFLKIVQDSESLYKISFYHANEITMDAIHKGDKILCSRKSKYPLKPKGIFRLRSFSSTKDYAWTSTFFGYDD
ncbi:hypothetical protein BGZ76_003192 [Entomortierella beljakovae]|nr:hypothetical protein BGZ76_003192 [Entomortierella beljakovae]